MSSSLRARLHPPGRTLLAGPWSAEVIGDELAHISYAGRQVLRAVKAVVRDQDWQTPQPSLRDLEIGGGDDGLQARWTVDYTGHGVKYQGELTASFTPVAVQVGFVGIAAHAFQSNRIGLVVLHPTSDAGRDITVEHPDGSNTTTRFPGAISPHQPFMDIMALEWPMPAPPSDCPSSATSLRLRTNETGQMRRSRPTALRCRGRFPSASPRELLSGNRCSWRRPRLSGLKLWKPQPLPPGTVWPADRRLPWSGSEGKQAGFRRWRWGQGCSLSCFQRSRGWMPWWWNLKNGRGKTPRPNWDAQLAAAASAAARQGAGLDIRAVAADPISIVPDLARYLPSALRLAVFHPASHLTEPDTWRDLKAAVLEAGFSGSLLAGARSHFTELNRNSGRLPTDFDALTFSITPQMHSTEPAYIIESVPVQRLVARHALDLAGGRPLHVGPVTMLPRFNAVATSGLDAQPEGDELQGHPFTAAWVLASISALAIDGVASVSYFEASGPGGISDASGGLNPAGELLKELAALRGADVLSLDSATGPTMLYPVQSPAGLTLCAGNLSGSEVALDIQLPNDARTRSTECAVFGQEPSSSLGFTAGDGVGHFQGRLTLGPWSAGAVRFPAVS